MADLTITAANVLRVSGAKQSGQAGEGFSGGEPLYLKTDGKLWKADCNVDDASAAVKGIALHPTNPSQELAYHVLASGDINLGATLTVGELYVLSHNVGKICPLADLVSGDRIVILGMAKSTSVLDGTLGKITGITK